MIDVRKCFGLVLAASIWSIASIAQSYSVKGMLKDTSARLPLHNASVVLLQAKDSFIVADMRTDREGRFSFRGLAHGSNYILFFSYPGYVAYSHKIGRRETEKDDLDLGVVGLTLTAKLLKEVIVKYEEPFIKIKGDTTEYAAGRFKVQPNATVEDLLKQLPGLQVDQYGNITAQGQKVKKVLVDGEEYFSDDPTLVTRNLRADMVSKVQVYDKRSDAATFTGIDDGIKDKTINLKIKEDKNHGMFGKAELGIGTDQYYIGQGIINAFKGKRKMALYGTAGNTGRIGLGTADRQQLNIGDGGSADYNGKGIPRSVSAGVHYDNKWNNDRLSINGNYKFSLMNVSGSEIIASQNNLATGLILSNIDSRFNTRQTNHNANNKFIQKPDNSSTITLYTDGNFSNRINSQLSNAQNTRGDSSLIYVSQITDVNDFHQNDFNINASWEKKLKKVDRTISFYLKNYFAQDKSLGENRSNSTFYEVTGTRDSIGLLYLRKSMNDQWRNHSLKMIFTEPISKGLSLITNYELFISDFQDNKLSYDLVADPAGKLVNPEFSSRVHSDIVTNQGGVAINYSASKIIFRAGNDVKAVALKIESLLEDYALHRQFVSWNPKASLQYKFNNFRVLNIQYNGNNNVPERTQLLPLKFNNGQLVTFLNNPHLENSFTHQLNGSYNSARIMSNSFSGINGGINFISSPIVQSINVDPSGKYSYQYVNMQGYTNTNYNIRVYYSKKIRPVDLQAGIVLSVNGVTAYSTINKTVNKLGNQTYSLGVELLKSQIKKYSAYVVAQGGYTANKSSLQPDRKNDYFFFELRPTTEVYFLKRFQLHTDLNCLWQQKSEAFGDHFSRILWNGWIGCNFLRNDQLIIKLSCNDILNQNNGYSRTANYTFFSEDRYTTIQRYFMLGMTWNFTKFKTLQQ